MSTVIARSESRWRDSVRPHGLERARCGLDQRFPAPEVSQHGLHRDAGAIGDRAQRDAQRAFRHDRSRWPPATMALRVAAVDSLRARIS